MSDAMATPPHESPEFTNASEFTVTITFTVAGGARRQTAERRARKTAARLADAATRISGVVEVSARGGVSYDRKPSWPSPIYFSAANSGFAAPTAPQRMSRYVAPEHEQALQSLAAANAAFRERQRDDEQRRRAVGCSNAQRAPYGLQPNGCACAYCRPGEHALDAMVHDDAGPNRWRTYRCLCGVAVSTPGGRCVAHRGVELILLAGDPADLAQLDFAALER
jgi:hypothetical protein